ncbi:hypothetical protein XENOCAPTIV_028578 [Xenoophorus captivus]|uniref:Uncharacterized protein n=1 Tax=Xenoophorus captivus TaxID=1517983 RepID=A0ABV0SEA4_9TELE
MRSSTDITALTSPGIIKPAENMRISGETKARRRTFAPQGHSWKSLKAGNLSDTRRSEDSYTDRRPRRHPAQVEKPSPSPSFSSDLTHPQPVEREINISVISFFLY